MNVRPQQTKSLWMNVAVAPRARALAHDARADVVVVGSGITGLSTAYELAQRGLSVVVLDRGAIAGGMTSRTSAHLASVSDDGSEELIGMRGLDGAKLFHASHAAAIDRIERIAAEEHIDCNFRRLPGYLFPDPNADPKDLTAEFEATRRIGFPIEHHTGVPFAGVAQARCLRYPDQAAFHPLRYLRGLAEALAARGVKLHANTPVTTVEERDGAVEVTTESGRKVSAGAAVIATNSPINERVAYHTKQAPYRSYVIATTIPKDSIEDALYWDTADPYHYVRLQAGPGRSDYLIVGGADHKTGEADDGASRFEALESWIRGLLPNLGRVTQRWSGQVLEPIDYAAFSGKNPGNEHVFVHTGDSGQGLTHGVMAGLLLSDLITAGKTDWADFYEPSRKTIAAAGNFISENVTAIKNFAEYVAPGELSSLDELKPGHGAIIRSGLAKIAAYRNRNGSVLKRSAVCTHLGCHVHWNSLEHCWDCPCHGSQFAADGTVLNGPAVTPLEPAT